MTAKQYLRQGYKLHELIKAHQEELDNLRALVGSPSSPSFDKIGGATRWNGDTAELTRIIRSVDLENQIKAEIQSMVDLMQEIHDAIEAVQNADERLVLRCRYILHLSWAETASRMSYSNQQVRRIHGTALQHIIVPEEYLQRKDEQE